MIYELAVKVLQIVLFNPFTSSPYWFLELNATLPLLSLHTHALTQNQFLCYDDYYKSME